MFEFTIPAVYVVTSTDFDEKSSIVLISTAETVANEVAEALRAADTRFVYTYAVERREVVR